MLEGINDVTSLSFRELEWTIHFYSFSYTNQQAFTLEEIFEEQSTCKDMFGMIVEEIV